LRRRYGPSWVDVCEDDYHQPLPMWADGTRSRAQSCRTFADKFCIFDVPKTIGSERFRRPSLNDPTRPIRRKLLYAERIGPPVEPNDQSKVRHGQSMTRTSSRRVRKNLTQCDNEICHRDRHRGVHRRRCSAGLGDLDHPPWAAVMAMGAFKSAGWFTHCASHRFRSLCVWQPQGGDGRGGCRGCLA
jgi:hypothetical protein